MPWLTWVWLGAATKSGSWTLSPLPLSFCWIDFSQVLLSRFFISRFWNHCNDFASRTRSENLKVLLWKPGWGCEGCLCLAHELSFYTALRDHHINQLKPRVPIWKGTQCCWKLLLQLNKWDLFCAEIQAKNIWGATSCPGCKKNAHLYFIKAKMIPSDGHKILLEMWFSGEFGSVGLKVGLDGLRGLLMIPWYWKFRFH